MEKRKKELGSTFYRSHEPWIKHRLLKENFDLPSVQIFQLDKKRKKYAIHIVFLNLKRISRKVSFGSIIECSCARLKYCSISAASRAAANAGYSSRTECCTEKLLLSSLNVKHCSLNYISMIKLANEIVQIVKCANSSCK